MFTGIITERGRVLSVNAREEEDAATIVIEAPRLTQGLQRGGSIAVNGVCLTAVDLEGSQFSAVVMGESLRRTTTGERTGGDMVNLERCVRPTEHLDGHVVQGHVDAVGVLQSHVREGVWSTLRIALPHELARYVAVKGSIAVDGVSLTVTAVNEAEEKTAWFEVGLIPETLSVTGLGELEVGDRVNLEVDVLAKYAERLLSYGQRHREEEVR